MPNTNRKLQIREIINKKNYKTGKKIIKNKILIKKKFFNSKIKM